MQTSKDKNGDLQSLSTIQKILLLQRKLKELTSSKKRFEDNKKKMLQKLDLNSQTYFKNKIYIKKIFDYCISHKPEENQVYNLIENAKSYLKTIYEPLYDFSFLIRNHNSLMLKIIEVLDKSAYEEFSDFFVNFLYVNISNNSFVNDELMLMIYLLLEKLILENLPDKININQDIPITYLNNNFLFYVFKALTRKIDIRNFLCNILGDFFSKLESFTMSLSVNISIVNKYLIINDRNKYHSFMRNLGSLTKEDIKKNKKKFQKMNQTSLFKKNSGNIFLKRTKKMVLGSSVIKFGVNENVNNDKGELLSLEEKLTQTQTVDEDKLNNKPQLSQEINYKNLTKRKTENKINVEKKPEKISLDMDIKDEINNKNKDDTDINNKGKAKKKNNFLKISLNINKNKSENTAEPEVEYDENGQIKIDYFFEESSNITLDKLKENLSKYEQNTNNTNINLAMKEYLNNIINQLNTLGNNNSEDKEMFSNSIVIEELKNSRNIKNKDSFIGLMRKIKFNHRIITRIIVDIIKKLKENLVSSPYSLKFITKIIDILLTKKYNSSSKNELSHYQFFMFKISFLIGNIILPILKKPEFNGIETNSIISEITNDNLLIISNILEKMITGNLFHKNENPYMTIFNKFIIDSMPKLFKLVENLEINFELPEKITYLIKTYDNNEQKERVINYEFFEENPDENINYQSICLSWKIIYLLLQIVLKFRTKLIDQNKNLEQKMYLQTFVEQENKYVDYFTKEIKVKKFDFIYFTKEYYKEEFIQNIKSKIKDNFTNVIPKENDDLITAFKKCIVEVLNYANKIQIENFYDLTERKDIKTIPKKRKKNKKEEEKQNTVEKKNINKKKELSNKLKVSLIKISFGNKDDDVDFKNILFPQIRKNLNCEINYNLNNDYVQRIIFCANYIHLYMRNIPDVYKKDNYSLLFDVLIEETEKNIDEYFKTNVLYEYYKKIKDAEKLNMMNSFYYSQIQNLEKIKCIEYLYNKLLLPNKFKIEKDPRNIISNIEYETENNNKYDNINQNDIDVIDYLASKNQPIKNMIDSFPDFHEYEDEYDNILDIQEKANVSECISNYFSYMKSFVKKEKIIQRFNKDEFENIIYYLENYILSQLHDKLFPFESSEKDDFFYKKCQRLGFIKPENITTDKKIINEKLWEEAIKYFDDLDDKLTPLDKIKCFAKVFEIVQNSIKFTSGDSESGVDDMIKPLIYIMIKSKPKNIFSNYQYCEMYLNSELSKKQYGIILSQIGLVKSVIEKMKHNDLIGVSEEIFGVDEEIEKDNA